ncbi:MAG: putative ribosomal N-acetyltransferase YdaF [Candidatus Anoxychlamydiales bacterium]|nr:putative ribosomal N-acetyltransferase YdaF [Candidatus Anoxychlamydiales bacterium]NGX40223.1 putative ribosomal N-acetyltransferase YdaF [Candidatus Anoxychlamydiales bacterium]HEU64131.1 N-acetyltransferase [Chlamydiota bacterium]
MIEGRNVKIRPIKTLELDQFFSILEIAQMQNEFFPFDVESEYNFKKEYESTGFWQEDKGLALILNLKNEIIGMISYIKSIFLDAQELKYIIFDEKNRGKGFMKESLKVFSSFLFSNRKINRLQLAIPDYHRASIAVAQKCGYIFEGIAREAIFSNGKYLDVCIYSLLRKENPQR